MDTPLITVFGSHSPQPGSEEYEEARELGQLLAQAGFAAGTGGYGGTMEAVLQGAGGGIGFTADIFIAQPNRFVTQNIPSAGLFERIELMIQRSAGFIVLRGGTGTLLELAACWEMVNKKMRPYRPIVCLGDYWRPVVATQERVPSIENLASLKDVNISAASYVQFAASPAEAISTLHTCLNGKGSS